MKQVTSSHNPQTSQFSLLPVYLARMDASLCTEESDDKRLSRMYEVYAVPLFKFCMYKLSNKEKATDLVADTFARTWRHLVQGNHIDNERSFLYTTARHLIIDEYRKKKCSSLDYLISLGFEVPAYSENEIYNRVDKSILIDQVNKLPQVYSSIIIMRYVNDLSICDISKAINTTENNVSVKIHRGLAKLKELVLAQA